MTIGTIPHPPVVSRDEWLAARKKLLAHEKELTKHRDRINAERRRLPMVKIEKTYVFDGPTANRVSQLSSMAAGSSLCITSCLTPRGRRVVRVALAM